MQHIALLKNAFIAYEDAELPLFIFLPFEGFHNFFSLKRIKKKTFWKSSENNEKKQQKAIGFILFGGGSLSDPSLRSLPLI